MPSFNISLKSSLKAKRLGRIELSHLSRTIYKLFLDSYISQESLVVIGSTIYIPIDTFSMCCNLWGSGTDTKRGTHNKRDFCRQKIASITNVHQFTSSVLVCM